MKFFAYFFSFCLLFSQVNCAGFVFPIKTKVIGKFQNWLSTWLSQAQYVQLIDSLEPQLNADTEISDMQSMLITAAMAVTTLGQKLTIAGVGAKFLTKGDITVPIGIFAGALANNLQAFAGQLVEMFTEYTDAGKTRERIFQRGYKMTDMFMTQKRVATIYCRVRKSFDRADVSWWPFLKANLNAIVKFTVLDTLQPVGTCN